MDNTAQVDVLEPQEEKKIKIGPFKPKEGFIEFIGTKGNVRFISDEAFIEGKYLSGLDMDDVTFKMTICDEGTVDLEEVNTNKTTVEQRGRLVDIMCDKSISPFGKSMVIVELPFTSVKKVNDKTIDLYLSVKYQTPISKLAAIFDEPQIITEDQYSKVDDMLASLFDEDEVDMVTCDGKSVVDVLKEKGEVKADELSNALSELNDSLKELDKTESQKAMEDSFNKMKEEKVAELQSRTDHQLKEIKRFEFEKAQAEKKLETAKEEIKILESRMDSLKPVGDPNGYYFYVSEQLNEKVILEENIANLIRERVSKVKSINVGAFMKLFEQGEYNINIGQLVDGKVVEVTDNVTIPKDIVESLISIGIQSTDDKLVYNGDLNWHDLVGKFIKKGFLQDPEFDKVCGSNSYSVGTSKDRVEPESENMDKYKSEIERMAKELGMNGVTFGKDGIELKEETKTENMIKKFNEMQEPLISDNEDVQESFEEFEDNYGYPMGQDFIFAIKEYNEPEPDYADFCLAIQPKSVWDNDGHQYDGHVTIDNGGVLNLPSKFEEVQESSFMYQCGTGAVGQFGARTGTLADKQNAPIVCIKEMVDLGLKFNAAFQTFMEQGDAPFLVNGVTLSVYMSQNYPNSII